jgi:hypothetical protein
MVAAQASTFPRSVLITTLIKLVSVLGTIPTQLNNLVNMKEFSVYHNDLMNGPILEFSKATELAKLE